MLTKKKAISSQRGGALEINTSLFWVFYCGWQEVKYTHTGVWGFLPMLLPDIRCSFFDAPGTSETKRNEKRIHPSAGPSREQPMPHMNHMPRSESCTMKEAGSPERMIWSNKDKDGTASS